MKVKKAMQNNAIVKLNKKKMNMRGKLKWKENKNKIGEKDKEWEMKVQHVGIPITSSLPISSCLFILKGSFGLGEEDGERAKKSLYQDIFKIDWAPFEVGFPILVSRVNMVSIVSRISLFFIVIRLCGIIF